jgi:4-amino-4-deoxy-L-arabinose transferase-like glycosyltransferase
VSGSLNIESLKKPAILIPLGLFFAAFLLRLVGIGWGLPNDFRNQTFHPDEVGNAITSQEIDIVHGDFLPGFYNYGSAYFIAESIGGKVAATYWEGVPKDDQAERPFWLYMGRIILAARVISALAGAGAVVVAWLILRRITSLFGALFGSALSAIAPGFLVHARFATPDVFATFWLCLSALFALRILGSMPGSLACDDNRGSADLRDALLAGLFAGISTGTKYTGVLVLIVLFVCLGLTRRPGWWKSALAGLATCIVAFVLTTPGVLLERAEFWNDFTFELKHTATGHGMVFIGTPSGFVYQFGNLAAGVGLILTLAGVLGLAYAAFRKHPWAIALLAFAIVYYIVIGRAEVKFLRYTFPLVLPLAVGYGYAMGAGRRRQGWGHAVVAAGIIGLGGLDFGGLAGAVRYTQFMTIQDPRDQAADYLRDVAKNGTVGFVKDPWFWSPPLIPDANLHREDLSAVYDQLLASEHPRVLRYLPRGEPRIDWDVRLLTEAQPDYVVFSSFEYDDEERISKMKDLDPGTQSVINHFLDFQNELVKRYKPARPFGDMGPPIHDLMYIRPRLWVWKRKDLR